MNQSTPRPYVRLGDHCEVTRGISWDRALESSSGIPALTIPNIQETLDLSTLTHLSGVPPAHVEKAKVRGGHTIMVGSNGNKNRVGDCIYFPHDTQYVFASFLMGVRPTPGGHLDSRYVYYWLKSPEFRAPVQAALVGATSLGNLRVTALRDTLIPAPALPVQRRIAGILSAYDELIENSQRRITILEAMSRALYREWFVHFRFPGHEAHPRVASPLGEIPQGWVVKKLGDVVETFRGRSYRSVDLAVEGGLPFLNLKCLDREGGFRRSGLKRYAGEFKDIHVAKKGDIVMAVTDMTQERRIVARAALVPTLDSAFGIFSMDLVRIEPKPGLPKAFIYSFLQYSSFADEVKQHANGANVLHLSPDRITAFRLPVPPAGLMDRFARCIAPVLEESDTLANKIDNLRRTRDLLLPRLLSGQIEVEAA